ncbi:hypothetical protein LTR99_008322 [Exophiala xenobiotica]|uniref:CsbD-like domain-containing protein n=1 Tax=Vermiconidia calcicola TaxID=1690605 RepID=A0AAV9PV23_9PEZI|nr:hypothetical protein LTR92_001146 [Exophiala xenobiotica]KAK5528470.1 hypothetical protein LTR25_010469 [Vermiconidia calcicola]KAK5538255.1 hypothetical protein LTR23_007043 [Chaetothyriales sp. CCFEE 6169]KAK5297919.1 hypothetical protein LTR99_008322 [Exophiala xenobiotica]KAK5373797.1 hypothetical protein LTS13_005996 [Exophiala xenobiotica]
MADRTQDKTHGVVNDVKSALKGIKGTGDAIRGTVNESVDTAFNDKQGVAANRAVKEQGEANMRAADQKLSQPHGTDTTSSGLRTGGVTGTATTADGTTTGAGAHSGGVGNMRSDVPQTGLGGEPAPTRERY